MESNFNENKSFRTDLELSFLKLIYEYGYDDVLSLQKANVEDEVKENEKGGVKK